MLLLLALFLGAPPAPTGSSVSTAVPLRLTSRAYGRSVEVEVRDLPEEAARQVIQKALAEISEVERLTDAERSEGGLATLNAAAGKGPQPLDPRLLAVLARAFDFCFWSEGGHGPLGRELYSLWGLRKPAPEPPTPERAAQAARLTSCNRLAINLKQGTATLGQGAGLDLWGFAEGHAVDRAVEILRQGKAGNGFVRVGAVQRGFGPGPRGKGWPVTLPQLAGQDEPASPILLHDSSLAIASPADHPLSGSETIGFPYVNQRTGQPAQGVLMTAALTELALDAQGLAAGLMIAGPREGQLRLGSLRPRPSVLWFLGSGTGTPLQVGYRWSEVSRR